MSADSFAGTAAGEWESLLAREEGLTPDEQFRALVERQSRFAFQVAYAVLRNTQDAEDVVQETFFKMFRSGAWKEMREERAFLARVAWRIAVDRRPRRDLERLEQEVQHSTATPEESLIDAEREATIHRLIDALPDKLRRPLLLHASAEMPVAEIAALMNLPEGTVRRLIAEARAFLREKLNRMEARKHV